MVPVRKKNHEQTEPKDDGAGDCGENSNVKEGENADFDLPKTPRRKKRKAEASGNAVTTWLEGYEKRQEERENKKLKMQKKFQKKKQNSLDRMIEIMARKEGINTTAKPDESDSDSD
ncbi:hypothetical protein SNE40_021955 [Patella caerulea]|uniref:Uncharacterized protein n=1 Tax=Patella caerulea TaxID=87958 RepID=A0AAN8G566_PATCE